MEINAQYAAFLISIIGGLIVVTAVIKLMRLTTGHKDPAIEWSVVWVGTTERIVTTALVIWAPKYVASFIGAWMAMKLAANWQREKNTKETRLGTMLALVGNVVSFAVAILAGLIANPNALTVWQSVSDK